MSSYDPRIVRHGDAPTPHYSVRYLGTAGDNVTVDFHLPRADDEPDRDAILDAAWEIVSRLASEAPDHLRRRTSNETIASPSGGLSRPAHQTEADTHGSGGRDTGTA